MCINTWSWWHQLFILVMRISVAACQGAKLRTLLLTGYENQWHLWYSKFGQKNWHNIKVWFFRRGLSIKFYEMWQFPARKFYVNGLYDFMFVFWIPWMSTIFQDKSPCHTCCVPWWSQLIFFIHFHFRKKHVQRLPSIPSWTIRIDARNKHLNIRSPLARW